MWTEPSVMGKHANLGRQRPTEHLVRCPPVSAATISREHLSKGHSQRSLNDDSCHAGPGRGSGTGSK